MSCVFIYYDLFLSQLCSSTNTVLTSPQFLVACRTSWQKCEQCLLPPKAFSRTYPEWVPPHPDRNDLQLHLISQGSNSLLANYWTAVRLTSCTMLDAFIPLCMPVWTLRSMFVFRLQISIRHGELLLFWRCRWNPSRCRKDGSSSRWILSPAVCFSCKTTTRKYWRRNFLDATKSFFVISCLPEGRLYILLWRIMLVYFSPISFFPLSSFRYEVFGILGFFFLYVAFSFSFLSFYGPNFEATL